MYTQAIVRSPAPNFGDGLTTVNLGPTDYKRALQQHYAYCAALERCGLTLTRLPADEDHPDSCFVEDTAVLMGRASNAQVMLTRSGAPTRTGEVTKLRATIEQLFTSSHIHQIEPPGTLDGGDVCEANNHFFIGISNRTNEAGAQQLEAIVRGLGYACTLVEIRGVDGLLHLKSGISYLDDTCMVVAEAFADREEFANYDLLHVSAAEEYAANCIKVNERVLIAAGFPSFEARLRQLGYQTIALEMSEFQKMDGGLSCLSLRF